MKHNYSRLARYAQDFADKFLQFISAKTRSLLKGMTGKLVI